MRFLGDDLWDQLRNLAIKARMRIAAVAYVTDASAVPFGEGDLLVVDASDRAIAEGATAARALAELFERGVRLRSLERLHAKFYVLDGAAIVGSANLSATSQGRLAEAGVLTTEPAVVNEARRHVDALAGRATPIDEEFIRRIEGISVVRPDGRVALSDDESAPVSAQFYVLREPPSARSKEMRSYLLALIGVQTGGLRVDAPFRLWKQQSGKKANINHVDEGRFSKINDGRYTLTEAGLEYFSQPGESGDRRMIEQFKRAIQTGNEDELPSEVTARKLDPLP